MNEPTATRKRPAGVWITSSYFIVSTVWSLFSFYLTDSGAIPISTGQSDIFIELTAIDHFLTIIGSGIVIAAAITLFLLKKAAFYLFAISLGLATVVILQALTADWFTDLGAAGILAAVFMWLVGLVPFLYSWRLKQKGVLR
ncbi:MAG: hypothetical protein WBC73_19805 [Phormidesmis sp.]